MYIKHFWCFNVTRQGRIKGAGTRPALGSTHAFTQTQWRHQGWGTWGHPVMAFSPICPHPPLYKAQQEHSIAECKVGEGRTYLWKLKAFTNFKADGLSSDWQINFSGNQKCLGAESACHFCHINDFKCKVLVLSGLIRHDSRFISHNHMRAIMQGIILTHFTNLCRKGRRTYRGS